MKTITLILVIGFFIGCSKYNLSLKEARTIQEQQKTQIIEKYKKVHIKEKSTSSPFKYTLSSFIPMKENTSGKEMSWMEMLKDYSMNSDIIYYIVSAISFIMIGLLLFVGSRRNTDFKKDKHIIV